MRVPLAGRLAASVRGWLRPEPPDPPGRRIEVAVDGDRCAGFFFCVHEAPRVFQTDPQGALSYRRVAAAEDAEPVVRAAQACPVDAIKLHHRARPR